MSQDKQWVTAVLVALLSVGTSDAIAAREASPCVSGEANLGEFKLKLPAGFCEYHFTGPDFISGRVVRTGSEEALLRFYAGHAGPRLESLPREHADEVCDGPIIETPTDIAFLYGMDRGHLVRRSRTVTSGTKTCRQAIWYVKLDNGSRSPSLLIFEYFGASPALRDAADAVIDHPIVTAR